MMIDDDDVAFHPPPSHFGDEAALPLATLLPDASVGAGIQFVPKCAGFGEFREFRSIPGRSRLLPRGNRAILLDLFQSVRHWLTGEIVELFATQIIVAAFHVTNRKPRAGSPFSV